MSKPTFNIAFLCFSTVLLVGCGAEMEKTTQVAIEPGVSLELAVQRKANISQLGYELSMDIPASKEKDIIATEVLHFQLKDTRSALQIDFKEETNHIKGIVSNGKELPIDHREEHIIIPASALLEGENEISIEFVAGNLSLNRNDEYLYTLLVPDRARTVFPCFDQPNLKASYQLSLSMPEHWQALTNGPLADSVVANGKKTFHFAPSDTISTYLFAFAAGDFKKVTQTVAGRTMSFFHRETDPEKISESVDTIFYLHAKALDFLEDYTNIDYPFKKFDFVAIPDFQYGGMEHVGAIQYRASSLFLDKTATESRKIGRANLIAHETAHMWFGDLVTMDWFNDVWMKEVFANFMADKISEITFPDTGSDLKFLLAHYPSAYAVDRTPGANPIRQQLDNLKDAGSMYGNIIYHKAPVVMKQLEMLMGKDAFQKGLQEYLKAFAFSNATWTDLISIMDQLTIEDLLAWNKVWVEKPFRPVFSYQREADANQLKNLSITQKKELQPLTESSDDLVWPQTFELSLGYAQSLVSYPVQSYKQQVVTDIPADSEAPDYIVFNTSGDGYGVFPLDKNMFPHIGSWTDPVARASAYINNYENMLRGTDISPKELIELNLKLVKTETEELSVRQLTGQIGSTFWQFITPSNRTLMSEEVELDLWESMQSAKSTNVRKMLFGAYQQVASSDGALRRLYEVWKTQQPPQGIRLSEDDYTSLAATICLLGHSESVQVQAAQLERISNGDRKKRWEFLLPALSADTAVRRQFFESLKDASNREKESWVSTAVSYLHHPMRQNVSVAYLEESLELVSDIQATGDIFFPASWLNATFGSHQSKKAAAIVDKFLQEHPDYPEKLKGKILQATDDLYRANRLIEQQTSM